MYARGAVRPSARRHKTTTRMKRDETPLNFVNYIFGRFEWAKTRPLFHSFSVFSIKQYNFLQQINVKKCPSSIWRLDLNSQPLDYASPFLTTRPGLTPYVPKLYFCRFDRCDRRKSRKIE